MCHSQQQDAENIFHAPETPQKNPDANGDETQGRKRQRRQQVQPLKPAKHLSVLCGKRLYLGILLGFPGNVDPQNHPLLPVFLSGVAVGAQADHTHIKKQKKDKANHRHHRLSLLSRRPHLSEDIAAQL